MPDLYRKFLLIWPWLAAILSGLLYAACFAPFNQGWLCWIALTPLISAVWFSGNKSKRPWLRNLLLGYVSGVVFFTVVFSWLGSLGIIFDSFPLRGLSLLLSVYLGVYLAAWAWFVGRIAPGNFLGSMRNLITAFFAATIWVSLEWIRGWLFGGFGWNGLGVALHDNWAIIQIAEITGVAGLSFVVAFANVIVILAPVRLFLEARARQMRPHFDVTLTLVGLVALCTFGLYALKNRPDSKPIHVAAIQPNVPQLRKLDPGFNHQIFDQLSRLSEIAVHSSPIPQLLVWPESAVPNSAETPEFIRNFLTLSPADTDLMLGADDAEGSRAYNSALLISNRGERIQTYRKIHLVPFGEYVPLRNSFPLFAQIAGRWVPADFDRGTDYTVFRLTDTNVQVAPLICFEDTIGDLTRRFVMNGANLLVNVTNDGWFLQSAGSRQHLQNAIFRCIETRRPMVRAANTGVTCFINEFGRITQILSDESGGTFAEGVLNGEINVPQDKQLTFYVRHGELFAQLCAGITVLLLVAGVIRSTRSA